MRTFEFTIIATGLDPEAEDFADRFFEAGCDDATISFQKGVIVLDFAREANTFASAVLTACADCAKAGANILHVEPDNLVSLSDIAKRAQLTRAAVSYYTRGERDCGFPAPIARVTTDSPLWDWPVVAQWLYARSKLPPHIVVYARIVKHVNTAIASNCPLEEAFRSERRIALMSQPRFALQPTISTVRRSGMVAGF